ncbi:MAG: hypothetical protein GX615_03690, partial [Lentisphaerae bacterium]|nr:hypothetical protein [Lentisphaerota bacterium]
MVFSGADLFKQREVIARTLRRCVRDEPHILWQFVLAPEGDEPLDLLDDLVAELRRLPGHWLDRLVSPPGRRRLAAR